MSKFIVPQIGTDWPSSIGRDKAYFAQRRCYVDTRGPLFIDRTAHFGYFVTIITQSHDIATGINYEHLGSEVVDRPVVVHKDAWIASGVLLYNCIVRTGAVVAAGTVLRSCEVSPFTMVAGNPPRVMGKFIDGRWYYVEHAKWRILG